MKAATGQTCVRVTATSTCAGKYAMNGVCTSCPSGMVSNLKGCVWVQVPCEFGPGVGHLLVYKVCQASFIGEA